MELKLLFWNTKSRIVIFGYPGGFPYFKIWKSYSSLSQRNKLRIRPQVSSDTQIWTGKSKVIFRIKNACIFPRLGEAIILCETRWYAHFFLLLFKVFFLVSDTKLPSVGVNLWKHWWGQKNSEIRISWNSSSLKVEC